MSMFEFAFKSHKNEMRSQHWSQFPLPFQQSCNVILQCILFSYVFRRLLWQFWSNFRWLWWVHTPYLVWVGFVFNSLLFSKRAVFGGYSSLRSKRFHIVSEERKTEERGILGFLAAREMTSPLTRAILWLSPLVFCSETTRKRLLRRLRYSTSTPFHVILSSNTDMMFKVQFHSWKWCN